MTSAGPAWRVVYFRPGGNPIRALAGALAAEGSLYSGYTGEIPLVEIIETYLRMSSRGLVDAVKKAGLRERTNLLLIADQFEELFRYRNVRAAPGREGGAEGEDATALVNLLLEGVRHSQPIYVVLTMRSDFLGDCSRFHGLPEAINEGQYLVPRLSREERRAAIAGPINFSAAEPHPALLTRLVNDVGDNPDQLSILQHALNRTWARWRLHRAIAREIAIDDYTDIGTMAGALDRHAEKAYGELRDDRHRQACERMFRALTDRGTDARGIRRPATLERLCAITGASAEELAAVMEAFRKPSRSFLMPPQDEPLSPDSVVDLSHESLMRVWRRLERWTEDEAQSARMYRRLADTAALHAEGKASLWRDPELQLAADWRSEQQPSQAWAELYDNRFDAAMVFLDQSLHERDVERAEAEFQRRWERVRVTLFGVGAVASLISLALAFPALQESLAPPQRFGVAAGLRTVFEAGPALALLLLALAGPFLLVYLAGEYLGKPAYRAHRFAAIARRVADRAREEAPSAVARSAGPPAEPDVRWQTTYAPAWRRAVAFVLDGLIAFALLFVAMTVAAIIEGTPADVPMSETWILVGSALGLILGWFYQSRTLTSARQATYGMRAVGVIVTDVRGDRLTFARATLRHACKAPSYLVYGLGLLIQPFTKRRQALHDWLSGSVVLTRPAPAQGPATESPVAFPVHSLRFPDAARPGRAEGPGSSPPS
jgi:uncharacterized RDD family membrane protein YckC